jgi:hypothetical protein
MLVVVRDCDYAGCVEEREARIAGLMWDEGSGVNMVEGGSCTFTVLDGMG